MSTTVYFLFLLVLHLSSRPQKDFHLHDSTVHKNSNLDRGANTGQRLCQIPSEFISFKLNLNSLNEVSDLSFWLRLKKDFFIYE